MKRKLLSTFLALSLILGLVASAAASAPAPFGAELIPLTLEELAEVEGEFASHLLVAAGGALAGSLGYLITTPLEQWSWTDALRHALSGALGGLIGHWCSD